MTGHFWKDRRVLITGASGFVGSHLATTLLDYDADLFCLQRRQEETTLPISSRLRQRVTVLDASVEDFEALRHYLKEHAVESVFHLASQSVVGVATRSPLSTFESNIRGTYCLLEACRQSPTVRCVVVASSDRVYGVPVELPCREDHPLLGLLPYDASKACADILVRSFAHSYSLPVAVTRCANTYGPGDLNLSRIVPGTIVSVLRGEAPLIRSDGTPLRDFIYVDDSVAAYLTLAERIEEARGHAFNFGTAEPVQILDLVQRIIRISGKEGQLMPRILAQSKVEGEIDAQYVSSEKAQACLGWTANVGLDEGLRRTIEWYKANLEQLSSRDQRVPALTSS